MGKNNGKNGNHDASRYLELAIQKSPNNPPAAFFWRAPNYILGTPLLIRVGGRFVYPPPDLSEEEGQAIKRVVFIAGGVGINPIMSMLEHLHLESLLSPSAISSLRLLYGTRATLGEPILFHERIARILGKYMGGRLDAGAADRDYRGVLYVTGGTGWSSGRAAGYEDLDTAHIELEYRRINRTHLLEALGPVPQRKDTVAYVCGPPNMTDGFVELLSEAEAMDPRRVLCEKWW
jgi:ferredoxin-NADP reductase